MRIKLRNLLNLTEQAPVAPPTGDPTMAPPATTAAPAGMNAGGMEEPETPPTPDTSPEPEDPNEYDFTKDFRAFEDKKNKAEADAKKVLMDKMNERLLGKTIIANSSRGYGQPKTDYTIKNVKKISVEFWYKDYVVIASDENDKKYFLTPGINIKIEQGEGEDVPAPGAEEPAVPGQEEQPGAEPGAEEAPNGMTPPTQGEQPATQADVPPEEPVAPNAEPQQQQAIPSNGKPNAVPAPPAEDPLLKKKKKLAENDDFGVRMKNIGPEAAQQDLERFFNQYFGIQQIDLTPYVRKAVSSGRNKDGAYHTEYVLEIPQKMLGDQFDVKDFSLEFRNNERRYGGPGQAFSRGSVDITPRGRFYTFRFSLSGGMDI